MDEYDVLLVLITVAGFVISVASVGVRFTKAIGQVKAATEALRDAVSELKEVIGEIKKENRRDHEDFSKRLNRAENRLTKLETEFEGQRRE
jgi:hypothetical protein